MFPVGQLGGLHTLPFTLRKRKQRNANVRTHAIINYSSHLFFCTQNCLSLPQLLGSKLAKKGSNVMQFITFKSMEYIKNDDSQSSLACVLRPTLGKGGFLRTRLMTCLHMPWILPPCPWIPWYWTKRTGISLIMSTEASGIHLSYSWIFSPVMQSSLKL